MSEEFVDCGNMLRMMISKDKEGVVHHQRLDIYHQIFIYSTKQPVL